MRTQDQFGNWGYMQAWTKGKAGCGLDFKGNVGNSISGWEGANIAKQILAGQPRNSRTQKDIQKTDFVRFPSVLI